VISGRIDRKRFRASVRIGDAMALWRAGDVRSLAEGYPNVRARANYGSCRVSAMGQGVGDAVRIWESGRLLA